jgi:hypothetical protein
MFVDVKIFTTTTTMVEDAEVLMKCNIQIVRLLLEMQITATDMN